MRKNTKWICAIHVGNHCSVELFNLAEKKQRTVSANILLSLVLWFSLRYSRCIYVNCFHSLKVINPAKDTKCVIHWLWWFKTEENIAYIVYAYKWQAPIQNTIFSWNCCWIFINTLEQISMIICKWYVKHCQIHLYIYYIKSLNYCI